MLLSSLLLPLLPLLWNPPAVTAAALSYNAREKCQVTGHCPPNTIIVGNGTKAHFPTLQSAISSLPDTNERATILLQPGIYTEQVNVTRSGPITILGQTSSPRDASRNSVTLTWAAANKDSTGQAVDNVFSSVLVVAPTLNSSLTGSGTTGFDVPDDTPFGNMDFRVYNVDFTNTWAEFSDGPAHAISFSRANGGFYYCGFYSYQDTVCLLHPGQSRPFLSVPFHYSHWRKRTPYS